MNGRTLVIPATFHHVNEQDERQGLWPLRGLFMVLYQPEAQAKAAEGVARPRLRFGLVWRSANVIPPAGGIFQSSGLSIRVAILYSGGRQKWIPGVLGRLANYG